MTLLGDLHTQFEGRALHGTVRSAARSRESAQPYARRRTRDRWWSPVLRDGTRPLFIAGDVVALAAAAWLTAADPLVAAFCGVVFLVTSSGSGLYRSRLNQAVLDDLPRLARAWLLATSLTVVGAQMAFSQLNALWFASVAGVCLLVVRLVATSAVRLLRGSKVIAHSTIIVGADATGRMIADKIAENPACGLETIGFVDDPDVAAPDLRMLGGPGDLGRVLRAFEPRALIIAESHLDDDQLIDMIRACHRHHCEVFILPRLHPVTSLAEDSDFLAGMPLTRLRRRAHRTWGWNAKRLVDVLLSSVALIALSPLLAIVALLVRIEGGPGVIFKQQRVGLDGRRFLVLKFRSMRPVDETESRTQWNIADDDRVGPVGRFLRKTSIDELPQLWNILRGDMSIVGPRPERPYYVEKFGEVYGGYADRHRVPCGLTGWAQVHGLRGDTSIAERAQFDNFYIENWSLWLDAKIMLRTVTSVVSQPGA